MHALEIFRQVERTGRGVIVTDRGKPVLRVLPYREDPHAALRSLRETVVRYEAVPFFDFVPVDNRIAVRSVQLPNFPHRNPADRVIVATALGLGAILVTGDKRLHNYAPLKTVWA